jgi:hypothetical protein
MHLIQKAPQSRSSTMCPLAVHAISCACALAHSILVEKILKDNAKGFRNESVIVMFVENFNQSRIGIGLKKKIIPFLLFIFKDNVKIIRFDVNLSFKLNMEKINEAPIRNFL